MLFTQIGRFIGTFAISTAIYLYYQSKKRKGDTTLPPIAPGYLPIVGHLFAILKPIPIHEVFSNWCRQVGPIYTCYFGSQTWIILNSFEVIKDLIVDRGNIYSSRNLPDTLTEDFFQGETGGGFAFFKYGPAWRRLRRIAHGGLVKSKINDYQPILDERRTALLSHLCKKSQTSCSIHRLLEYYAVTSILSIAFGNMCSFELGDPVVHQVFGLTERVAQAISPADQLREFFPLLKRLWPVKRDKYFKLRDEFYRFYSQLLAQFKSKFQEDKDTLEDCFVKEILISESLTDLQIMYFIGVFVGAGSDTTATTMEWLIAFLANYPETQEKAFQEIQKVVGLDRLPEAEDESELLYLQCILMETLRLRPPAPISIPHSNTENDEYHQWLIPKDTIIVMNLFAANQDEARFKDPQTFNPDRHWDHVVAQQKKQVFTQSVEDRPHLSFSTGRRVCVGIHLAERSLFMAISMMLACFKFERLTKEKIDTETPRDLFGAVLSPCHYEVRIVPRHDRISQFI